MNRDISIKPGQVAHLDRNPQNNELHNLAFMCFEHHDQYDSRPSQSKGLSPLEVRRFREELHEVIDRAWKQPLTIGETKVRAPGDVSGHYVRETANESAEIEVTMLPGNRVRVSGLAFWGTTSYYGPNIGELDFEAPIEDGRADFRDQTHLGEEYQLELIFEGNRLIGKEGRIRGPFGMNVSFQGEYRRVEPPS